MTVITIRSTLLLLSLLTGLSACRQEEHPQAAPRTVMVQTVAHSIDSQAVFTGEIRARHEVDLSFRVGGRIASRLVDAGSDIKGGQPLARLDPRDLQLAANAAQAQLSGAESDLSTAHAERERYAGLLAKKFVSQAAFDARDNAFNAAQARLQQARAQREISDNQAAYGTLSSEFPAVVTAVLADAGQVVAAGQPVLRIARPEEKEVLIAVPESRLAELRDAETLAVNLWSDPKTTIRGVLRELSPAADPATRTYFARIRLIDPGQAVRLGMTARVTLNARQDSLRIPLTAVLDLGQGPSVWVISDGKATPRPVRVARFLETGAEISDGLAPGDQVVIAGANLLAPGQPVKTVEQTPPERQR